MALQLKMDPSNLEAGAAKARAALDKVKQGAFTAESAIDAMAKQGAADMLRFDAVLKGPAVTATAMQRAFAATQGETVKFTGALGALAAKAQLTETELEQLARAGDEFDRLKSGLDPAYAALQRYETAVEQTNAALRAEIITQEEANRVLGMAEQRYTEAARGARNAGQAAQEFARDMGTAARGSGAMGFQVQNAAYQVGDFFVQVSGGTSAMRAMSQQLPQLLGGFGLWGAVIGGVVAAGAALVPMLFDTADAAKSADENIDALSATLSDFNKNADIGANSLATLREQYGQWANDIQSSARWMAQVNVGQASDALKTVADDMLKNMQGVNQGIDALGDARREYEQMKSQLGEGNPSVTKLGGDIAVLEEETRLAADALGLTVDQVAALDTVFLGMRGAATMDEIQAASKSALDAIREMYPAGQAIPPQVAEIAAKFQAVYTESTRGLATMQNMPDALNSATGAAGGLASAMGQVSMAANAALSQMIQMDITRRATMAAAQGQAAAPHGIGPAGMGDGSLAYASTEDRARAEAAAAAANFRATAGIGAISTGGGGGGGGSAQIDRTREAYDRLMASLDPVIARTQDMAEATSVANAALAAGDISAAEHAKALELIAEKYGDVSDQMTILGEAGASAFDRMIEEGKLTGDMLKDLAKDIMFATVKAELLKHVIGGTGGMSIGSLLVAGITGGFHDKGGNIPMGTTGMVGEYGPELVRATSGGAMVTSRVETARQMQQPGNGAVKLTVDLGLTIDDEGKIKVMMRNVGQAAHDGAVKTVKQNLGSWTGLLQYDGALA